MSEPELPDPEHVPDSVLDELSAAFGAEPSPPPSSGSVAAPKPEAEPPRRTIVIPEDDQPDTVYLDEDKEERFRAVHATTQGERETIFISDLDDGAVVEPAPTRGSAGIDPRIRARRIAVRRSEGRRRLVWVAVGVILLLVIVGAIAVLASPIFEVREVRVEGAVYTDEEVLVDIVADIEGDPVLLVDLKAIEERLEEVAWVEQARVRTDFPHTIVIDIRERQPLATFQGSDEQWRVIDVQGRVLDVIEGRPVAYMLITGNHPDTSRGQFAGGPYASAAVLVASLPGEIRRITESVGLDASTGTLTMHLEGDVEVRLGDGEDLDQKLARLLGQVRDGLEGVAALDVSTAEIGVVPG
jgi:cell division protein FtsQ